jgi:hypothetical protein
MYTVRQEENGKTLRLFNSESDATAAAQMIARGALERFRAVQHKSGNGWLVQDKETGRQLDADGPI